MKRRYGIDLVKVIAASLVIIVHYFSKLGFYSQQYLGKSMVVISALFLVALSCVPLFLISTGFLLSKREPNIDHYKKLKYFMFEFLVISILCSVTTMWLSNQFGLSSYIGIFLKGILSPVYYIGLYFSLYLIAPFLNRLFNSLQNDKERMLFLGVVLIVMSLPSSLNSIPSVNFFDPRPTAVWSVMYYIIGLYISYYQPKIKKVFLLLLIPVLGLLFGYVMFLIRKGSGYVEVFGYYESIFVVFMSTIIFLLLYNIELKNNALQKVITFVSASTLTIFVSSVTFSDLIASKIISRSGNILFDLITTTIPFTITSIVLTIPFCAIVYISNSYFKKVVK